jgi:branched-chain amino acid transport system permease protein
VSYLLLILTTICIFAILTVTLNLLVGYTGIPSFAHGAFFGIGAYVVSLAVVKLGLPFLVAILVGVVVTGLIAALVGIPALRLGGDYFFLACFALIFISTRILSNWEDLTNGARGLYGIPRPSLFGQAVGSGLPFLVLSLAALIVVMLVVWRLVHSPYGLTLQAIRDDELAAATLGRNVTLAKVVVFGIGAGLAAVAGGLFATFYGVIEPNSFGVPVIILLFSMLFIGGAGNLYGPILGAAILLALPEGLRLLGIEGAKAGEIQQMIYGLLLVVLMLFRPQGLAGKYLLERQHA